MPTRYNISLERLRAVVDQCGFNVVEEKVSDGYIQIQMRYETFTGEFKRNIRIDSAAMDVFSGDTEHWNLNCHYPDIYDEGPDRDLRKALSDYALIKIGAPAKPTPKGKDVASIIALAEALKDETTHLPKPKPAKGILDELAKTAKEIGLDPEEGTIRGLKGMAVFLDEFGEIEDRDFEAVRAAAHEKEVMKKVKVEELKARLAKEEANPDLVKRMRSYAMEGRESFARPTNPLEGQW